MIAEKESFCAAVSAAIFAFGISFGAIFCPVTAFGLQADSWALLLVCIAASIAFAVLFRVFRLQLRRCSSGCACVCVVLP